MIEYLYLLLLVPLAIVVVLSTAYWLQLLFRYIRSEMARKRGIREARKVEREKNARIRRQNKQREIAKEILNILVTAQKEARKNRDAWVNGKWDTAPYMVTVGLGSNILVNITIDFRKRHQVVIEDENGKPIIGFPLAKDGVRWIRHELVWRLFGIWS